MTQKARCAFCPLMKEMCVNGWTKSMGEDEKTGERPVCQFWTTIYGKHPQTGETIQESNCALSWMPIVMLETAQKTTGVANAIEDFRNRMVNSLEKPKEV